MTLRLDIQALRGLAVSTVVLFHARLGIFPGGYLGVDIFFVISGFLITSMLRSQIERGKFSFTQFYFRRAKRLLPAAYTTFTITALLAIPLLTATEFRQFADQLLGAVTFTANFVLRGQGSYFGGDADLKLLLHTWSLSIEEQYYLIVPALLFFTPPKWWLPLACAVVAISLLLCLGVGLYRPDFAFYMFPTRAWELGVGSIGALTFGRPAAAGVARPLFWPALALLVGLPLLPAGGLHPGIDAVLACIATLIVILRAHPLLSGAAIRPLAWVGDISYSLYLIHWPLFAFATNIWVGDVPLPVKLAGIGIAVLLAWLQYRFVENPIRQAPIGFSWPKAAMAAGCSAAVIGVPFGAIALGAAPAAFVTARQGNTGLGAQCVSNTSFVLTSRCATGNVPTELVWGDSYAMHLMPGIVSTRGTETVAQATKYVCGPLLDVAPVGHTTGTMQNRIWAEGCLNYNRDVISYLERTPSVHTVILSSVFKQYMTAPEFHILRRTSSGNIEQAGGIVPALEGIGRTINAIRAMDKKVVVIAPPPALDWDAGLCTERRLRGLLTMGTHSDCAIPDAAYREKRANVLKFMGALSRTYDIEVIMFDPYLRKGDRYDTSPTGKIWFIANGHLSYTGSTELAARMKLGELIARNAR